MPRLPLLTTAALLAFLCWGSVQAQTRLITEEEAKAPNLPLPSSSHTRAITRAPGIRLISPAEVNARAFAFKLAFEPRGGAQIQPESVRIEYLKQPIIDLTPRLVSGLRGNAIDVAAMAVPTGTHPLRISVRDSEGREAQTIIQLHAK